MVEVLLETLVEKVITEGMRANSGYKKQVWPFIINTVQKVAGLEHALLITKSKC